MQGKCLASYIVFLAPRKHLKFFLFRFLGSYSDMLLSLHLGIVTGRLGGPHLDDSVRAGTLPTILLLWPIQALLQMLPKSLFLCLICLTSTYLLLLFFKPHPAVNSEITPGGLRAPYGVSHVQFKCPTCCTISWLPTTHFKKRLTEISPSLVHPPHSNPHQEISFF